MNTDELLLEVEEAFPFVSKPNGLEMSFHKVGCSLCEYLRADLQEYSGQQLPSKGLRCIYDEMSCLSAKGWQWVFPSYLRYCLTVERKYDDIETEFFIYNLSPQLKYQKETIQRLSLMSQRQVRCLVYFLEWCAKHEHWGNYCSEEIARGIAFLRTIRA